MATEENVSTALTTVNPKNDQFFIALGAQAIELSQYAQVRVITCTADLQATTNDLNIIKALQKQVKEKLASYIKPFVDYVNEVKAAFWVVTDPLDEAEKVNRAKSTAFLMEQECKAREAEAINQAKIDLAKREAALKGMVATESGVVNPSTGEVVSPVEKMVVPMAIKKVYADTGSMAMTDKWTWELVDWDLVPKEYKVLNECLIGKVVRSGVRIIPGIKIWNAGNIRITRSKG